jgi:hypothetical protein
MRWNWMQHRNMLITISVVAAAFLFGITQEWFSLTLTTELFNLGINIGHVLGIGLLYSAFALWKRYI